MADDPESKRNEELGPTHEITRSSVQQNKLENSTAVGSDYKSAKISEVNSDLQSNMDSRPTDSGNGILGKGKISFSFRKKPFNPSLVQYSDEDSATSEKEDSIDGKDQMNAKTGQSLLKSANLPLTTPKMTKEHAAFAEDLSEIPIPPDSGSCTHPIDSVSTKNRSPARIHGPTSIEQKYNTQYTKLLATKTRLEEKLKEIEQRGKKDRRNETESANNNMLVQQTASQAVSVEKMTSLKNDSLMLYEETDKVEIKQGFVQNLSQSSDVTNDLNLCNIDGKNAKVNQAAKDDLETNNLESCSDVCTKSESKLGLSAAKQDNQNNHADVCNVRNKLHRSPVPQPKIDLKKDDLSENGRQPVNSECADTDSKRTNAGSQLENESQNSSARVSKPKHKQSETQSDIKHVEESSLSSSSSSESEDDESSSSSTSSSSSSNSSDSEEEDTKVSDIKSMETSDHDSPGHKVLDASGSVSKTVVRKPENAELVDPSRQTTDTIPNQSVSISSELFSPYSPSKPTDEDADIDQTACCDTHPHTTRPGACSFEERCSIQGMNTTNTSVDSTECFDSKTTSNNPTDWDKDNEKEWSKEDHAERALAHLANQSSSSPKEETSIHLTSAFTSDTKYNDHESSLQYRNSYASATATSCIQDNEERMISSDLHVSSEKVMEQPSSSTTSQEQHHYIVPPNAPSWNLVEITSNSSSKQHERSHHTKTADGSCKLAYNHSSALDSQTKYQTSLTSPEKHECVDERDRSHRERDHSRGHDWNYDRHRDYGRSRHHRSRDDERDAKTGWDRERDRRHDERFQRYRRSKSRDWDGKSRDRKSRSKERDRVSRSKEWDRRSRSKERDRHSRSRERDRRSKSRERDHYPRTRDQIKRSHSRERDHPSRPRDRDRRSGSRDRKRQSRSRDTIRRSRSRDRERRSRSRERETWSRSRRERRSRSRERRRSRDRYDRDYRRRSRRSPSCEHSDHHRLDDKRERHSSCHYRDEARSQRDHDRELRRTASTVVSTELENIPLPPAGYNLGETHSYLPADSVPIPTISQSYVPPPPPCFEEPLRPAIPERVPQTTPSQCQQRNLIYPPTVEMDNVSDIESVDMDVANSPDEAKTSEPGTRTSDVHSIPVISKRTAKDEKPAARVAFMMKTVPKKSAIYRQVLEVLDDDGSSKPSMSQLLPQDGTMTTAVTCEQTAEHSQDPGYHISEPKSSGYSKECHQSVMVHTSSSSNDNATVGMIPLPGLIRATPESTQQQISDIPVPDSVQKGVSQSSSMQDILLDESVSTVTTSAAHPVDVQSTSQLASTNESIHKNNSEDKSEGEMQRAISAADDSSENETPLTRRRSLRLKSLEEKKEVRNDDVQETNRKKKRGRNDKGPEDATEASCESAENQPATSMDQSDGMSSSTPKSQFMSPEARDVKADDLGTPSLKPEKVKSRWRRWSELEASSTDGTPPPPPPPPQSSNEEPTESAATSVDNNDTSSEDGVPPPPPPQAAPTSAKDEAKKEEDTSAPSEPEEIPKPAEFELITEHVYVSDRKRSKCRKEARRMVCDCVLPTKEEYLAGHRPCGDECLNRMLFIECGSRCPCSEFCTNKRFQKRKYAKVETFYAGAKGWGLKTKHKIDPGAFIMEYVGEVLDYREFRRRSKQYSRSNMKHFYFMALNADEVIDATQKGNVSRFINHSCDPNCETQKWTVNGQLRIGFFAIRPVEPGEELTFDYQFESYGQAQKCYCGSENCRGYIGTTKKSPLKELTNKPTRKEKKKVFDDVLLEEEINDMMELEGMKKRSHVLELARLMVRAVSQEHRLALLKIIQDTKEPACLRLFLDYHGLSLLWSWMVDAAEGSTELKVSILNVLKQLPVTNKTVLKESNIMSIVERWAAQVNETKKEETKDEASESSSSGRGTPIVSGKESSQSTPTTPSYEGLPHKKRKLFQQLQQQEEASSSDGDTASESGKKDATSTKDDTDSQMGDPDSKESESEIDTAQMESEKRNGDWTSPLESDKPMPSVSDIASELISAWGSLKEVYKIPKICAEERKKTEQELDQRYGLDRHDVVGSNKEHKRLAGVADWSVNRDGKRRRLSSNRDDDTKGTKSKKVLLPTPPEASLSKQKRRALFEAQVKAQDEFVYQQQIQQQQLGQYPPGYQFDPNSPYPDPNLAQYPVQPGVAGYASTPNVPIYQSEGSIGSFSDPNVSYSGTQDSTYVDPSVPGQVPAINTTVQTQMIVQPDGSYITAPQPVSTTFQQPAIASTVPDSSVQPAQFVDPNQTTESSIQPAVTGQSPATGQFVEQTPAPIVYQTPTQTQYQAPVATPFISQPVTATVSATPATVSYVMTPSQQAAPQYVQTQPVQQVYYTTPQGQVIVQQQPVVFQGQTQVVAVAEAAQGPRDPREPPPPPPSPPPKAKKRRLPPNWKTARDSEGKIYYYHTVTRQTQWDPPAWEEGQEDDMDLGTPTHDEPKTKKKTTTAAADTSTETAKRIKDHFRAKMSRLIVSYLNPYRRPDCKTGRITSTDDFKHLARKLTHTVLEKELKHCHHLEDLEVNENVKAKTKDYIKKYMSRFGPVYKKATTSP